MYKVVANCSNSINFVLVNSLVKVGLDLTTGNGLIRNQYAHVNDPVSFVVRVNGGNGYQMEANFGDSNKMLLTWTYLSTKGAQLGSQIAGYVPAKATFTNDSVSLIYAYKNTGNFKVFFLINHN